MSQSAPPACSNTSFAQQVLLALAGPRERVWKSSRYPKRCVLRKHHLVSGILNGSSPGRELWSRGQGNFDCLVKARAEPLPHTFPFRVDGHTLQTQARNTNTTSPDRWSNPNIDTEYDLKFEEYYRACSESDKRARHHTTPSTKSYK